MRGAGSVSWADSGRPALNGSSLRHCSRAGCLTAASGQQSKQRGEMTAPAAGGR